MPLKAINTIPSSHFFKARMIKQLFFFVLISDPRVGTDECSKLFQKIHVSFV